MRVMTSHTTIEFTPHVHRKSLQAKRKALAALDSKLAVLAEARAGKEEDMKGLERILVQVLVEQQKKLLALLSEVRPAGR